MTAAEAKERLLHSKMPNDAERREYDFVVFHALDKQIPKKPYWEYGGWHCKSCGLDVLSDEYFCPLCGQAIDWEETDNAHT